MHVTWLPYPKKFPTAALNKAPVLLTTPNRLLLYVVGDRRDFCLQNR